jgi:hypothetical protein
MDIRSYFDTIPHDLLLALLKKKIEDTRFIGLIQAMLDAGYLEDWQSHATYSGVPQGSIGSPILANVFLHELDLFMKTTKDQHEKGGESRRISRSQEGETQNRGHTKTLAKRRSLRPEVETALLLPIR